MNCYILLTIIVFMTFGLSAPSVHGWEFGTFETGDVFVYGVCDYSTMDPLLGDIRDCYILEMFVIERVQSSFGNVWIIHVTMSAEDYTFYDVILVDDSFNIYPFDNRYLSESLSSTIFWMNHHARITYFDAILGDSIHIESSPFFEQSEIIVSDFKRFDDHTEYNITFDGDRVSGDIWIRDDAYLPIKALIFKNSVTENDLLFSFELISITDSSWWKTDYSNIDDSYVDFEQTDFVNEDSYDVIPETDISFGTLIIQDTAEFIAIPLSNNSGNVTQNTSQYELPETNVMEQNISEIVTDGSISISEQNDKSQRVDDVESVSEDLPPADTVQFDLDDMFDSFEGILETLREFFS